MVEPRSRARKLTFASESKDMDAGVQGSFIAFWQARRVKEVPMSTSPRTLQAALLLLGALSFAGCQSPSQSGPSSPMPPSPPSAPSPSSPSPPSSQPPSPSSPSPSSPSAGQPSPQQSGQQQPPGAEQQAGSEQAAGQPSQPTASTPGGQPPAGDGDGDAGGDADGSAGSGTAGSDSAVDDDGVLAQAVEVFRRSAARSRSSDAPSDGDGAEGGMEAPAGSRQGGGDGGMQDDLDDLVSGDLDDMIAGGGSSRQSHEAAAEGVEAGGDVAAGGDNGGDEAAGPWHQPGASGSGRAPTSEETYGDAPGTEDAAGGGGSGSQTAAERHAELERVLADAMGDFDGRILDERATILARRGNAPGTIEAAGRSDGEGAGEADRRGGRDAAGRRPVPPPPAPSSQEQPDGQSGSGTSRGSVGGGEVLPVPEDVGDGANDDVVARQLREAAMAETDPELREKLWDEYRRYVAGRR